MISARAPGGEGGRENGSESAATRWTFLAGEHLPVRTMETVLMVEGLELSQRVLAWIRQQHQISQVWSWL